MAITMGKGAVISIRHPEHKKMSALWEKYRLAYEGGAAFMDAYLSRFSKAESTQEYNERKAISYVPAYAKRVINVIRNSIAVKMAAVSRKGDARYIEMMNTDVDNFQSSMATFLSLEVVPLLVAQGKRFIVVDAPPAPAEGTTQAEDANKPFLFAVNAEDVLSWHYTDDGTLLSMLVRFWKEKLDADTGLVDGVEEIFALYRLGEVGEGTSTSSAVSVKTFNSTGDVLEGKVLEGLTRIPIVELRLVDALLTDIADMQVALMNLASTDMSFLYRSNFPIYTEQIDPAKAYLKPVGSEQRRNTQDLSTVIDTEFDGETTATRGRRAMGASRGRAYGKELDRPDFIAPPTSAVEISLKKQDDLKRDITVMADLALTSLSMKALEQSGKSKDADRIGEEAGLAYIATVLESGERDIALLIHEFLGATSADIDVKYPTGYTIRTNAERAAEIEALKAIRDVVNSPTFYRCISKRIAEIGLKQVSTEEELREVDKEIDDRPYVDESETRSKVILGDVNAQILSKETAAVLRGYGEEEAVAAAAEAALDAENVIGAPPVELDEDEDEVDPIEDDEDDAAAAAG